MGVTSFKENETDQIVQFEIGQFDHNLLVAVNIEKLCNYERVGEIWLFFMYYSLLMSSEFFVFRKMESVESRSVAIGIGIFLGKTCGGYKLRIMPRAYFALSEFFLCLSPSKCLPNLRMMRKCISYVSRKRRI